MNQKWWLNSTTIRGALVTILPVIVLALKAFGVDIATEEQDQFIDAIASVIGLIGTIYAIIGRFEAKKEISIEKPKT